MTEQSPLPQGSGPGRLDAQYDDLALAAMLASRICHDVIGPVGALLNGVEMMRAGGGDPDFTNSVFALIEDGGRRAASTLEFFRAAFGVGGMAEEEAQLEEARVLAEKFLQHERVRLEWSTAETAMDRRRIRLLLNLILLGAEALPRGGRLQVTIVRRSGLNMVVAGDGAKARLTSDTQGLLLRGEGGGAIESRDAAALLTHRLARRLGATLRAGQDGDRIALAASF